MNLTNSLNLPQPFVSAAESDHKYTPKRYSVTTILKGTREAIIQRRHDDEITQDVADMVWAIFGSAVHQILQNAEETETQLKENYIVVDMPNGYQLSGIFDLYDDSTGTVTDYKTASAWKAVFGSKGDEELSDWRNQTMIYCWMLRQIGFDAKRGEIVAILKDHKKSDAKNKADYPKHPVWRIGWDFTDEELEECGKWLVKRFEEIEAAEKLPDDQLPMCTEAERWHRADKWAVMKEGRKTAVRLYESEDEANARADQENATGKGKFYVVHRPGEDPKCMDYCSACHFCDHYKQLAGEE